MLRYLSNVVDGGLSDVYICGILENESLLGRNVESYTQQMEYQDDQPSNYPTDRADEHGEQVDGYVVCKKKVRQEQENHSDDPIDDEPPQVAPSSCE